MATGTGSRSDPRIVYDWSELANAFQNYNYIELGADIDAPQESASLAGGRDRVLSLDGKGFSIINLFTLSGSAISINANAQYVFQPIIKNISFVNINCQADNFLKFSGVYTVRMENIVFSGSVFANSLIYSDSDNGGYVRSCGANIHTNNPQFKLISYGHYSNSTVNNTEWGVDYGNIAPDDTTPLINSTLVSNTLIRLRAPTTGQIAIGECRYCAFSGEGKIKITSSSPYVNLIENTLTLDNASTGNNHVLSPTEIRDIQTIYDLGFPASGVV